MGEISAHACMITNVWQLIFATFYWNALMLKAHRGNHSWGNIFNHWVGIDHSKQLHNLIHSSIPTLWWMVDQRNEKAMRTPIYSLFRVLYSWICFTMNAFKMNIERLHLIDKVFQYRQTCRFKWLFLKNVVKMFNPKKLIFIVSTKYLLGVSYVAETINGRNYYFLPVCGQGRPTDMATKFEVNWISHCRGTCVKWSTNHGPWIGRIRWEWQKKSSSRVLYAGDAITNYEAYTISGLASNVQNDCFTMIIMCYLTHIKNV